MQNPAAAHTESADPKPVRKSKARPKPEPMFYSVRELAARYGVHPVSVWRWVREGNFPQPLRITANSTRWRIAEVERFERLRAEGKPWTDGDAAA